MVVKSELKEDWEKVAWELGGEARANQLPRFPGSDYKYDLAFYANYENWLAIPPEKQKRLGGMMKLLTTSNDS